MKTNTTVLANAVPMMGGFTTPAQQVQETIAFSVEAVYTGTTIAGTLSLQCSNTYSPATHNSGTWVTITGSSQTLSSAGAGMFNLGTAIPGYSYFRVVFTDTGSSANAVCTVTAYVKGLQ